MLFEALQLDREQSRQVAPSSTPIQRTLKTWVTVATPFLKFSVDWQTMVVPLLILLSTAGVTFLRFEWFQQYWQQISYGVLPWWHTATAFVASRILALLVIALFLRLLFNTYVFKSRGCADTDQRRQASQDLSSAALAFGTALITATGTGWLIGSECRQLIIDTAGIGHIEAASAVTLLALTCLSISAVKTLRPFCLFMFQFRRNKRCKTAWSCYKDKHRALPVGFETRDEAVRGLHAIIRRPVAEILPRIHGPDRKRFWGTRRYLINPERESFKLSFVGWIAGSLLLPFSIFIDWVVKGLYNNLVCVALDSFVLTRLWKAAQGCDVPGLKMVDCQPLPFSEDLQNNGHQDDLPVPLKAVEVTVSEKAGKLLERARAFLGGDFKEGVDLFKLINRTLAGDENDDILFHTTYLNTEEVAKHISETCARSNAQDHYSSPGPITSSQTVADAKWPHPGQIGFYWWMLRYAILGCVLAIPAVSLYYACESIFFGWSRDHFQLSTRDISGRFNVSKELRQPEDFYLLTIYMKAVSDRSELQRLLNSSSLISHYMEDYLNAYDGNTEKLQSEINMHDAKKRFGEFFNAKGNPESIAMRSVTDRRKSVDEISNFGDASLTDSEQIRAVFRLIAAEQYQAAGNCLQSLQFPNWLTVAIVLNRDVSFLENEPLFGAKP